MVVEFGEITTIRSIPVAKSQRHSARIRSPDNSYLAMAQSASTRPARVTSAGGHIYLLKALGPMAEEKAKAYDKIGRGANSIP